MSDLTMSTKCNMLGLGVLHASSVGGKSAKRRNSRKRAYTLAAADVAPG